jgi:hypothetical protein
MVGGSLSQGLPPERERIGLRRVKEIECVLVDDLI